jgi:hypothetical protein
MLHDKSHICRVLSGFLALCLLTAPAYADSSVSTYALRQALTSNDRVTIFSPTEGKGFNLKSSYYSGYASGVTPPSGDNDFNDDQRLYALLVDGRYDFTIDNSPITPHLAGGMGMASTLSSANMTSSSDGPMVPLLRVGGGVAYRLGEQWDMSLDYTAGHATASSSDQSFTGRGGGQPVDLQTLNLGMHYTF